MAPFGGAGKGRATSAAICFQFSLYETSITGFGRAFSGADSKGGYD